MKKIKITVETRYVGSADTRIVEVEDDATEEDIEKIVNEIMWEMIGVSWKEVDR